jgi:hypothetical protein
MRRFFLAHRKADTDDELAAHLAAARAALLPLSEGRPFEIVLGRDFFASDFKRLGSWEAWAMEVAQGVDYATREPLFHAIVVPPGCPGSRVGAATAHIVRSALLAKKPVCRLMEGCLVRVTTVRQADPNDWRCGFEMG